MEDRGFSLVELLVVISIMGLLIGGVTIGLNLMSQREDLNLAGGKLVTLVRKVRTMAINRNLPAGVSSGVNLLKINIQSDGDYEVTAVGAGGANLGTYESGSIKMPGLEVTVGGTIKFQAGSGRLMKGADGVETVVAVGETAAVRLVMSRQEDEARVVWVNQEGVVDER